MSQDWVGSSAEIRFPAGTIFAGELRRSNVVRRWEAADDVRTSCDAVRRMGQITHVIVGWTSWRWSLSDAGIEYAKVRLALFPLPSCTKAENSASKSSIA